MRAQGLAWLIALIALPWLLGFTAASASNVEGLYRVEITTDGLVIVSFNVSVSPGLNPVPLPVEPVEATIETVVNGVSVPPLYVNGTLYIASESVGSAFVTYTGKISVTGGVVSFNVSGSGAVELVVPPNVILLSLPQSISSYEVLGNGTLVIVFKGPAVVEFTLREILGTPTATSPSAAPTAPSTTGASQGSPTSAQTTSTQTGGIPAIAKPLAAGFLAAFAVAVAMLYLRRRGRPGPEEAERPLTEADRLILKALEEAGGEALQSELQRMTGLPKTTLWRRLRRLEEAGYVELRREGKVNRVKLLRKPG